MNRPTGRLGEDYAVSLLEQKGYQIIERNYHSRYGEIDIIAQNGKYIVFAEVKTRDENYQVSPLEAVTPGKQKKNFIKPPCSICSHTPPGCSRVLT